MAERLIQLLLIAAAGASGTLARFGLTSLTHLALASLKASPWRAAIGTLAVNLLGSFLFGLFFALTEPRMPGALATRLLVLTGFMGAFTTFSTFSFDVIRLARESHWVGAVAYITLSVGVALASLCAGLALGQRLTGHTIAFP